jgi:hypothetical protein
VRDHGPVEIARLIGRPAGGLGVAERGHDERTEVSGELRDGEPEVRRAVAEVAAERDGGWNQP